MMINRVRRSNAVRRGFPGFAATATLASALAIGFGGADAAVQPAADQPAYVPGVELPTATGFSAAAAARFAALRGPVVPVPDEITSLVPNGGGLGANTDLARRIQTVGGTGYVFPAAKDGVCTVTPSWDADTNKAVPGWVVGCTPNVSGRSSISSSQVDEKGAGVGVVLVADGQSVVKTGIGRAVSAVSQTSAGVASARLQAGETLALR